MFYNGKIFHSRSLNQTIGKYFEKAMVYRVISVFLSVLFLFSFTTLFAGDKTQQNSSQIKQNAKNRHAFGVFCDAYNEDWENPEKTVTLFKELGVRVVISRIRWKDIEKEKGKYSEDGWKAYDGLVDKFASCGINVVTIITSTPTWAIDSTLKPEDWKGKKFGPPPQNPNDVADFASVVVRRYKDKVKMWAFFNAPQNQNHWIEPAHLADLYKAGYTAVKKEQPDSVVIMSGLEGCLQTRESYLGKFLKAGGGKYVDMYDFHILLNAPSFSEIESFTNSLKETLKKFGEDKKTIQYGAIGWPSLFNPPARWQKQKMSKGWKPSDCIAQSAETQATRLVTTMVLGRSLGIDKVFWTRTRDFAPQSGAEHQQYTEKIKGKKPQWKVDSESTRTMGIVNYDYSPKPSYHALKTLIGKIDEAVFVKSLNMGNSGKGCIFKKGDTFTGVFWVWEGNRNIELSSNAKTIQIQDVFGKNIHAIPVVNGKCTVNVTNVPIYLEGDIKDIEIASSHSK